MRDNMLEKLTLDKWRMCFNQERKVTPEEKRILQSFILMTSIENIEDVCDIPDSFCNSPNFRSELVRQTVATRDNRKIIQIFEVSKEFTE
jgi:hypothetical protein